MGSKVFSHISFQFRSVNFLDLKLVLSAYLSNNSLSISGLWLFQKKLSPLIPSTRRKLVYIPVDQLFNMLIVLLSALPVTLILLAILGVFKSPGFNLTMLLYAGIFWIFIARIVRGEVIRVKEKNYILSAQQT